MSDTKQSTQTRFLIAAVLSMLVLLVWTTFISPPKPPAENANTAQNTAVANQTAANQPAPPVAEQNPVSNPVAENVPQKTVTVKTPLYQVKLDSRGAVATSWQLLKNVSTEGETALYADGSNKDVHKPLELISPRGLESNPREVPFKVVTADANLDNFINERNYQVSINEENVELTGNQTRQIDFVLRDESNGLEVTKSFLFRADSYVTDLGVKVARNGQVVPNTKLLIGPSIGDQGIEHHNYYHIEPESVAYVNGKAERHAGTSFTYNASNEASLAVNGELDWAGVGDAYFAMAAVPSQKAQGLEYRASRYEVEVSPFYNGIFSWITRSETTKETRHLISAYVPIAADGSMNRIYTGTKDYFVLSQYNKALSDLSGRTVDIEDFINYGYLKFLTKPLSIPILKSLNFINNFTHNYGGSIIIFTIFFYSLLFPLRWYQSRSFKKAQKNAPKMKELQDKMKELQSKGVPMDDPRMREVQMEQLKMTKDALPIGGCLPLLLQFPLLIALYVAVTISLNFRQATFLWLPDLSAGDPFHFLEFLFAGSMMLSMLITPTTPTITPEQKMQQKMMIYLMPAMMLWVMWSAPAGLLIYWVCGNIVSFVQQILINRINKTNEPPTDERSLENAKIVTKKPKLSAS